MTGSGRLSASMDERSRHVGKRVGCAGIVSAAVVTLGLSVHHDLQITAAALGPASIRYQTATFRQEECLYHALRSEVPKGATVYVYSPKYSHTQRLAELSTLWAVPQANLATARWRLSIVPAHGHCSGLALEVCRRLGRCSFWLPALALPITCRPLAWARLSRGWSFPAPSSG